MCGITGIIEEENNPVNLSILKKMASKIQHRGPDEKGYFVKDFVGLAIRRLSIIDLNNGCQPKHSVDNRYHIIFNGEIYNYKELKIKLSKDGYKFQSNSDTEVILAAFILHGTKSFNMLDGMFAFAIYDDKLKKVTIARDRFGVKPLYYSFLKNGAFIFASEIKALIEYPNFQTKLNPKAIDNLLTFGFQLAPDTFFENISSVLPGHYVEVCVDNIKQFKYWDIDYSREKTKETPKEIAHHLVEKIEKAVAKRLISDVPVASYLSGGIDSSIVTGIYSKLKGSSIKTFSIGFEDERYNELTYAQNTSKFFNTQNCSFLCEPKSEDFIKLIYHLEEPLITILNLPLFYLSKKVHDSGFKVVLSGDGSDEFFGGYNYFKLMKIFQFIEQNNNSAFRMGIISKYDKNIKTQEQREKFYQFLKLQQSKTNFKLLKFPYLFNTLTNKKQLLSNSLNYQLSKESNLQLFFDPQEISKLSFMDQMLYIESKFRLLNLTLPLSDKMSMANSVENRSPFLDYQLAQYVATIPNHLKIQGLNEKYILKKAFADFLPLEITKRKKNPLSAPAKWFLDTMGPTVEYYLSDSVIKDKGYFNPVYLDFIQKANKNQKQIDYSSLLLIISFIHLWDDIFIAKKVSC